MLHHEVFKKVAHLEIVDKVGMDGYFGHSFNNRMKAVAGIEFLDLITKLKTLENRTDCREKPLM